MFTEQTVVWGISPLLLGITVVYYLILRNIHKIRNEKSYSQNSIWLPVTVKKSSIGSLRRNQYLQWGKFFFRGLLFLSILFFPIAGDVMLTVLIYLLIELVFTTLFSIIYKNYYTSFFLYVAYLLLTPAVFFSSVGGYILLNDFTDMMGGTISPIISLFTLLCSLPFIFLFTYHLFKKIIPMSYAMNSLEVTKDWVQFKDRLKRRSIIAIDRNQKIQITVAKTSGTYDNARYIHYYYVMIQNKKSLVFDESSGNLMNKTLKKNAIHLNQFYDDANLEAVYYISPAKYSKPLLKSLDSFISSVANNK